MNESYFVLYIFNFARKQKHISNIWLSCQKLCFGLFIVIFFFNLQAHIYSSEYVNPNITLPEDVSICSLFLANIDEQKTVSVRIFGKTYSLPPWSVSILPDCKTVAYNTAKVVIVVLFLSFSL